MNDRPIDVLQTDLKRARQMLNVFGRHCPGTQSVPQRFTLPELDIIITALERATVPEPVKKAIHEGLDRFQGLDADTLEQHERTRGDQTIIKKGE